MFSSVLSDTSKILPWSTHPYDVTY